MANERVVQCPICLNQFKTRIYNKKVCSKQCAKIKDLRYAKDLYFKNKKNIKNTCKVCKVEYIKTNNSLTCSKKCSRKNSNRIKLEYAKRNGDVINERIRKKRKENEDFREKEKERRRGRVENDPLFRLRLNISNLINEVMRKKGLSKKSKSYKILKCSYEQLYAHLTKSFENNYKIPWNDEYFPLVHIDHIVPMSSAKNEEGVYELNHYKNLQFLYYRDNIIKSDNLEWELDLEVTGIYEAIEKLKDGSN